MITEVDPGMKEYLKTLSGKEYDPISKKEERKLLKRYKKLNDTDARNALVKSNMRYACSLVTPYIGKGLSYSELLSEANNGLIDSIDKFDMKFDIKLYSYSKWWIHQRMQMALSNKNNPKIKTGELPTENNREEDLDDEVFSNNDDDVMPKEFEYKGDEEYEMEDRTTFINTLMKILTEREAGIINMYFGIGYDEQFTLSEIGEKYNITKERVRQIIETALKKIRSEAILMNDDFFGD